MRVCRSSCRKPRPCESLGPRPANSVANSLVPATGAASFSSPTSSSTSTTRSAAESSCSGRFGFRPFLASECFIHDLGVALRDPRSVIGGRQTIVHGHLMLQHHQCHDVAVGRCVGRQIESRAKIAHVRAGLDVEILRFTA